MVATGHITTAGDHTHAQDDVTGLPAALDGKASTGHNHDASYSAAGHNHDASYSAAGHNHDASYSAAGHNHTAADTNSGTFDVARIPTGTSGTTVALGNHTHASGFTSYANATLGTGVTTRAGSATPGSRGEPGNVVRLRGAIDISGNPASGTVILTLDSRDHPVSPIVHPGIRTGPTGNISCVLLINTSGQVTLTAAPGTGAYLGLDGITYDKAAS